MNTQSNIEHMRIDDLGLPSGLAAQLCRIVSDDEVKSLFTDNEPYRRHFRPILRWGLTADQLSNVRTNLAQCGLLVH